MERTEQTARVETATADDVPGAPEWAAPAGEAALAEALFAAAGGAPAEAARIHWVRAWGLWASLALAALVATERLARTASAPTLLALALAGGTLLGVTAAYVWMRRAFGERSAAVGSLLFAASGATLTISGPAWEPLVPALLALWALLAWSPTRLAPPGGRARVVAAALPLALTAWLVPAVGALGLLAPVSVLSRAPAAVAGAGHPSKRSAGGGAGWTVWLAAGAATILPLGATALGATRASTVGGEIALVAPGWLVGALAAAAFAGWTALVWRLLTPARALWRWYALARDARTRRRAVWTGLRAEPRWSAHALLWLASTLIACTLLLGTLLWAPHGDAALALLPIVCALPGQVVAEPRASRTPRQRHWFAWLWLALLIALAGALAAFGGRT